MSGGYSSAPVGKSEAPAATNQQLREALIILIERCSALPNITNSHATQSARAAARTFAPLVGYVKEDEE